jgi:dTDP-glucose 4,6-dehydratase
MMQKLLITGGAGFIGSEFVRQAITRDYRVTVIDKLSYAGDLERLKPAGEHFSFHKIDIADREAVQRLFESVKPDIVAHWAAESHVDRSIADPSPFLDTNIRGTLTLLDTARHFGVGKFINISTDEVYGDLSGEGQFCETTPLNPSSPYSVSKASADMLGRAYHRTYGVPVMTVRPSNNYGPWQYPEKLIPVVIWKALQNEQVPVYAKGENVREWLFVSDCVEAVFEIMQNGIAGEIYNVGSGEEKRNIDVVRAILQLLGKNETLISFVKDRLGHDFRYSLNSGKILAELDWKAKVPFGEGIEKTVAWYVDHMDWVKRKLQVTD